MSTLRSSIPHIPCENFRLNYIPDVTYARRETRDLKMRILTPNRVPQIMHHENGFSRDNMDSAYGDNKHLRPRPFSEQEIRLPAVIHLMGSGFNGSEGYAGLASFSELARRGIVLANIDYRGASLDDTRFPDAIQDVKEAVRFLRKNAGAYGIDPERIVLMGSSSGGYTVSMAGVTGDEDAELLTGENLDVSSRVRGVIDMFGPQDFELEAEDRRAIGNSRVGKLVEEAYSLFRNDPVSNPAILQTASVLKRISPEKEIPPFLIFHGDQDRAVPHRQSERLFEALKAAGKEVSFYTVIGAGHEFSFSTEATELVAGFILSL